MTLRTKRVQMLVSDITVGERTRKDMGDIESLMASIEKLGLLQPVGVNPDGVLLFGGRRLEACTRLGYSAIDITTLNSATEALVMLEAELEENTERHPFTVLEAQELRRRIRDLQAPARVEAQRQETEGRRDSTGRFGTAGQSAVSAVESARAIDEKVAGTTGHSLSTLQRVERIQHLQESDDPAVAAAAASAIAAVEAGAPVKPALDAVLETQAVRAAVEEYPDLAGLTVEPSQVVRMKGLLDEVRATGDPEALEAELESLRTVWAPDAASDEDLAKTKADQEQAFRLNNKLAGLVAGWPATARPLLARVSPTLTPTTIRSWQQLADDLRAIADDITGAITSEGAPRR